MKNSEYIPGKCNINSDEIGSRFRGAVLSFFVASIILLFLLVFSNNKYFRLVLLPPVFLMVLNLLQTEQKFCVFYALNGEENSKNGSNKTSKVKSLDDRKKDRTKAYVLILISLIISAIITLPLLHISNIN